MDQKDTSWLKAVAMAMLFAIFHLPLFAQQAEQNNPNARRTVVVGDFSGNMYSTVRRYTMIHLQETHRLNLLEEGALNSLPRDLRANIHPDAILRGQVTKLNAEKKSWTVKKSDGSEETRSRWIAELEWTLTLIDPASGQTVKQQTISATGSDDADQQQSLLAAIKNQATALQQFIDNTYRVHSTILSIDEVKKNKAKTVTIGVGSSSSIYRNMEFSVEVKEGGEWKEVGTLVVHEINNNDRATCTVTAGGDAIAQAFENDLENRIISNALDRFTNHLSARKTVPDLGDPTPGTNDPHNLLVASFNGERSFCSELEQAYLERLGSDRRVHVFSLTDYNALTSEERARTPIHGIVIGRAMEIDEQRDQKESYTSYQTKISWMVSVVDVASGTVRYDTYQSAAGFSASSQSAALQAALGKITVGEMIDRAYPISTSILTIDEATSKKAKTVTIGVGTAHAIQKGMTLSVYVQDHNGNWQWTGEIKITQIIDDSHSSCTVKNGGAEIKTALEEGYPTRVITGGETSLFGLVRII